MTITTHRSSLVEDPLLKEALHEFLTTHNLMGRDRETHFVVAYSGGPDSTALLHSLVQLGRTVTPGFKVTAACYWHPWRPLHDDLQTMYFTCKQLKLPWYMLSPDLTLPKTETAAREDRYNQLARLCHDLEATALLTGHHQDDQVETILFRILRGTGIEGLTGIPGIRKLTIGPQQEVLLARPFLNVSRAEIMQYIQENNLPVVQDPTNEQIHIKRNLIRRELIPQLEGAFPHARQALLRLATLTQGELEIIDTKMDEVWTDVYKPEGNSLDEVRFNQLALPFQRRVIRRYLEQAGIEAGHAKVEEILDFIAGKGRTLYVPALFSLDNQRYLYLYRGVMTIETPPPKPLDPVPLNIPGEVSHRQLKTTVTITRLTPEQRMRPIDYKKLPANQAYVDLSRLEGKTLSIRTRQQGDWIRPLGMTEPVKLKRFFINRYVPRFKRDMVPLIAVDSEVLWAVGVGLSEGVRVKDRPTHIITVKRG